MRNLTNATIADLIVVTAIIMVGMWGTYQWGKTVSNRNWQAKFDEMKAGLEDNEKQVGLLESVE